MNFEHHLTAGELDFFGSFGFSLPKSDQVWKQLSGFSFPPLEQMTPQNEAICISIYMHYVWLKYYDHNSAQIAIFTLVAAILNSG